jgi:hypothetical protein
LEESLSSPRYPEIRVVVHSRSPLALISAIRLALRKAGVERGEISRFSQEALDKNNPRRQREVCGRWVRVVSAGAGS